MDIYNYAGILHTQSKDYFIEKLIKEGGTSKVFLISDEEDEKFALKIYKDEESYESEINCLYEIFAQSEDIIQLHIYGEGYIEEGLKKEESINIKEYFENKVLFALFNYIPNGELSDYVLKLNEGFPEFVAKRIFIRILNSLDIIHRSGFIHKDLKLENILVDENFDVKLIDFGFSRRITDGHSNEYCGTKPYSAPEELSLNAQYITEEYDGIKSDIFSLGIILLALVLGKLPFKLCSFLDPLYSYIAKEDYDLFWSKIQLDFLSRNFKDIVNKMISFNPSQRCSLDDIYNHPWIINDLSDCKAVNEDYLKIFMERKEKLDKIAEEEIYDSLDDF